MPLNYRLKDIATVLILHNLQMSIELSDQSSKYDAGAIVEVAPIICLNNLTDNV
jgi:ABC-type dipeptide/oligopeptide/nickel transport system ATPase component